MWTLVRCKDIFVSLGFLLQILTFSVCATIGSRQLLSESLDNVLTRITAVFQAFSKAAMTRHEALQNAYRPLDTVAFYYQLFKRILPNSDERFRAVRSILLL